MSTKIPFKGTSKEYIGEDVTEMQQVIKFIVNFLHVSFKNVMSNFFPEFSYVLVYPFYLSLLYSVSSSCDTRMLSTAEGQSSSSAISERR